jgi:tRNA(Ile)-lysidine synthetase-like protein
MSPSIIRLFNLVEKVSSENTSPGIERNIVVMCSGGMDSVAALHYFAKKNVSNLRVNGYHFNHKLRPQNEEMHRKVQLLCHQLKIPLLTSNAKKALNTEAEYREARMAPLRSLVGSIIVTGHHLNDCVESYLLNCFRGHQNYLPIPFYTQLKEQKDTFIAHPFILVTKEKLKNYCIKHDLMQYVEEDDTNTTVKGSRRNFLRNQIIPILDKEKIGLEKVVKKIIEKRDVFISASSPKELATFAAG